VRLRGMTRQRERALHVMRIVWREFAGHGVFSALFDRAPRRGWTRIPHPARVRDANLDGQAGITDFLVAGDESQASR
jgi:hypothetical protein